MNVAQFINIHSIRINRVLKRIMIVQLRKKKLQLVRLFVIDKMLHTR